MASNSDVPPDYDTGQNQSTSVEDQTTSTNTPAMSTSQKTKGVDRSDLAAFKHQDVVGKQESLLKSKFAQYKTPKSDFERCLNILCVSWQKKTKFCAGGGSKDCDVLNCWRQWSTENVLSEKVPLELEKALSKMERETKRQSSITSFFQAACKTTEAEAEAVVTVVQNVDEENNNNGGSAAAQRQTDTSFLAVFGVTKSQENMIKSTIDDIEVFKCQSNSQLLAKFVSFDTEVKEKETWTVSNSRITKQRMSLRESLKNFKDMFERLVELCNKDKHMEEAMGLDFSQIGPFLDSKVKEAKTLAKEIVLKLSSKELKEELQDINHYLRRRISNIDLKHQGGDRKLIIKCGKSALSWSECLQLLDDNNWQPTSKNGNVTFNHLEACYGYFKGMELRRDEYVTGNDLLDWLGITEKKILILDTIVSNLPIMMIRNEGPTTVKNIILLNITTFLGSEVLIADVKEILEAANNKDKANDEDIEYVPGVLPSTSRKEGSGRSRFVDKNPDILEAINKYVDSTGIETESRRRDYTGGRIGFVMEDFYQFVVDTCFPDYPGAAPSISTLRRTMEAPSKCRKSRSYYKEEVRVRTGTKRNDAAPHEAHPHRHECFTQVRLAR